jgi:hypothetical protein
MKKLAAPPRAVRAQQQLNQLKAKLGEAKEQTFDNLIDLSSSTPQQEKPSAGLDDLLDLNSNVVSGTNTQVDLFGFSEPKP